MKVAVLQGGRSLERGVSLRSGARVGTALADLGHEVVEIDPGPDLTTCLEREQPDVVFIALHGIEGEDGTIQSLLDLLRIPYTGSGAFACQCSTDKALAKHMLRRAGLPTPDWLVFSEAGIRDFGAASAFSGSIDRIGLPAVVKPVSQGSSLGIKVIEDRAELPEALVTALSYDQRALLETFVPGRELTVSILGGQVLPILEVMPQGAEGFDFTARYEIGGSEFHCPAELDETQAAEIQRISLAAWNELGCEGFARVDVMLGADGPWILEVNAVPGLTETSLLPQAAEAAGISFPDLIERLLQLAIDRSEV